MAARYVVLGLAPTRSSWFRSVAQWSNQASIPVEFVKAVSLVEVRAHLASGRPFSALLVDAAAPHVDRDAVEEVRAAGCAVIVVDDVRIDRDWAALGVDAVINPVFDRKALLDVLAARASEVIRPDAVPGDLDLRDDAPMPGGVLAMVCGPGGTGASTTAVALAQGLAHHDRFTDGDVLLADLALRADQAMLHDAGDIVPGIQELVDAHRSGRPSTSDALRLTSPVVERRYRLLLGLRRRRNWATIRPRAFAATLDTILDGWPAVVCDTDGDLEGEAQGGSADVEDRNLMARTVADRADVVVAVGNPGLKGTHSLVMLIGDLLDHGVPADRIIPVINRAPKSPRVRAEITSAIGALVQQRLVAADLASPLFLSEIDVEAALRDGVRLPAKFATPLAIAVIGIADRVGRRSARSLTPIPIAPGSLGSWSGAATT